jgi:hypothetical protein
MSNYNSSDHVDISIEDDDAPNLHRHHPISQMSLPDQDQMLHAATELAKLANSKMKDFGYGNSALIAGGLLMAAGVISVVSTNKKNDGRN